MTENTETQTEQQQDGTGTDQDDQQQDGHEQPHPSSEAAKYRVRLREAEAERDQLRDQLQQLQAETVTDRLHSGIPEDPTVDNSRTLRLIDPDDLYRFTETAPRDYLADDGRPDTQKLSAAVGDLIQRRPELQARPDRVVIPNVGDTPADGPQRSKFQSAFGPEGLAGGLT